MKRLRETAIKKYLSHEGKIRETIKNRKLREKKELGVTIWPWTGGQGRTLRGYPSPQAHTQILIPKHNPNCIIYNARTGVNFQFPNIRRFREVVKARESERA